MSDAVGDLFDPAAGAVGSLLKPTAPAEDFFGLGVQEDPSSLIRELGQGLQDAAVAGLAGQTVSAVAATQPNISPRDRLLLGGLLLAGGVATGRAAYARWKGSPRATTAVALPEQAAQAATELKNLFPGRSDRQLNMMAQADNGGLAAAIARFEPNPNVPDERLARIAARLDEYEQAAGSDTAPFAAFDWARLDDLGEAEALPPEIQPIYDSFADGLPVSDDEWVKLSEFVGRTTDLERDVGLTGRLDKIIDNNGRPLPVVRYNPPPPGDVFQDPSHRTRLMAELNARPQFEQAVANIEELYRAGRGDSTLLRNTDAQVSDREALEVYWGLDFEADSPQRYDQLVEAAFRRAAENLKNEFGSPATAPVNETNVKDLAGRVWMNRRSDHRDKFAGWADRNPFRLKPNGEENPAFLALIGAGNELPASFGGLTGEKMPAKALTTKTEGLTLFVDDDVTYAYDATRQADHWMRNMFPGPLGDDGRPRWLPGRPLQLRSFDTLDTRVMDSPTAVVETMHSEAYPGFKPGDYIAFDHGGKVPPWAQNAERMLGGAARARPTRATRKLSQVDLVDEIAAREALDENAWAVFVDPTDDLLAGLQAKRFHPVSLREGDAPAVLVFGNAEEFAPDYTHAGWREEFPDDPDAETPDVDLPESEWTVPTGSGERVALVIPDTPYTEAIPRVTDRVTRYVYKVDQREAHQIAMLAADLENTGASNLAVYSRQPRIDGFEVARERVYRGPAATVKAVRTADPIVGDSNAVSVHVRVDSGLPTRALDVDPSEVSLAGIEFEDLGGGRVRVNVEVEDDLSRKLRDAADLVHAYGHGNVEVVFEGKRVPLFQPTDLPRPDRRRAREERDARNAEAPPPPETRFWGHAAD